MKKDKQSATYLSELWDSMKPTTEVFLPVHKADNGEKVILYIDSVNENNVGEIRAFLSEDEIKSYLGTLSSKGIYVRYSLEKLDKNMKNIKTKKPELKLDVVLYAVDMADKFYRVDVLWTYLIH